MISPTLTALISAKFLLTPLREGRHTSLLKRKHCRHISTHAPAGGATFRECEHQRDSRNFYSRPCGRGDVLASEVLHIDLCISTHAPAGGATLRLLRRRN